MERHDANVVSGYRILGGLGRTSGSRLYRARRLIDEAPVLLKLLEADPDTPEQVASFERELALLERLRPLHHAGARPLELLIEGRQAAMVLPDCGGEPLEAALTERLPVRLALRVGVQLADALGVLHDAQLTYGDLHPMNLLLARGQAHVCLVDLSRAGSSAAATAAHAQLRDHVAYRSPEQTGWLQHAVDARSDLYSVGVILYHMLGGALPFQGGDTLEWIHCHVARTPVPLVELAPDLPHTSRTS